MAVRIERAAVLGAGVMGAGIAAHLANAGIETILLDLPVRELSPADQAAGLALGDPRLRGRVAAQAVQAALKSRPAAFFTPRDAALITVGDLDADLARLADVDLVIEAVVERLDVKQQVFAQVAEQVGPDTIVASNTSGLSVAALAGVLPEDLRRRFLVLHFFNPPRYLRLLEIVPGPDTAPEVIEAATEFGERALGKGVVVAKDTPNFIANRIGTLAFCEALHRLPESGCDVTTVDRLTGPLIGRPRSATFRTADLVGLDVLLHVCANLHERLPDDPYRDRFVPPGFVNTMVERGLLGAKTDAGFYRKEKHDGRSVILGLDPVSLEYALQEPATFESVAAAKAAPSVGARIAGLVAADDGAGRLLWQLLSVTLDYAARCVPEISDDLPSVDRAMRWGFGWELGPFELWDALGPKAVVERMQGEGRAPAPLVADLLSSGRESFYAAGATGVTVFGPAGGPAVSVPPRDRVLDLSGCARSGGLIAGHADASLIDIGDDVACLAFHSKMNTITEGVAELLAGCVGIVEERFRGLVIGNDGDDFCAGANLMMVLGAARQGAFDQVERMVGGFQQINQALRFCRRPVVVVPRGRTLGGGVEITLHGDAACASAETYMGLVEVGVGLIPAGGGCKELLRRVDEMLPHDLELDLLPFVQRMFEVVGMARVSTSAREAQDMGLLRRTDRVVMNVEHGLHEAKSLVLALDATGYTPPRERRDIRVIGEPGFAALRAGLYNMAAGGLLAPYDAVLGEALAKVLCGGELTRGGRVSEQYLLDLEREAFLSLAGDERTQARMQHLLETGKPLRN